MKKIIFIMLICIVPVMVFAKSEEYTDYVEITKYFKTITIHENSNNRLSTTSPISFSSEVSKEEYDNYNLDNSIGILDTQDGTTETNYKKMTTSIRKIDNKTFRYKVNLDWKTMPSTRSYDIIGIGFSSSVKVSSVPNFEQNYCLNTGSCRKIKTHSSYNGINGVGASFLLPSDDIKSLSQTLYIDVIKTNSSVTISRLNAYGDYSHAQKTISKTNAQKYLVDDRGIVLNSSIESYYDSINTAKASWTGTW